MLWTASGVLVLLVLWQLTAMLEWVDPRFLSSPVEVLGEGVRLLEDGAFWADMWITATEFFIGFAVAVVVAVPLGLAAGWLPTLRAVISPHVTALYSVPRLALIPLVILWFGIGFEGKAALVFLAAFFPIVMIVMEGVGVVDSRYLRVASSYGASTWRTFGVVVVPSAVPFILTGIRLAIGRGLASVVAAELFVASAGLGFRMGRAAQVLDTAIVFVGVVVVAGSGLLMMALVQAGENRVSRWKH